MNATSPAEPAKHSTGTEVPQSTPDAHTAHTTLLVGFDYAAAHANLRGLLRQLGRREFRAYGYARQLRQYRRAMQR